MSCKTCDTVEKLVAEKTRLERLVESLKDAKFHREFEVRGS